MNQIEIPGIPAPVQPPQWKHRHKWQPGWQKWLAFVKWVFKIWPRNP